MNLYFQCSKRIKVNTKAREETTMSTSKCCATLFKFLKKN